MAGPPSRRSLLPKELLVNLLCADQIFKLLETREGPVLEEFRGHVNPLEQFAKLLRAAPGVPDAVEGRQMFPDFFKGHPVTAIVLARRAKRDLAAHEDFGHNFRDLSDSIVVPGITHVEHLIMHRLARGLERRDDGPADVQTVNYWPLRRAIAGHPDFLFGPGQPGEIVQHDVEAHSG